MDIVSSLVLEYDLSVLMLLVVDPPEGHTLLKGMSLFYDNRDNTLDLSRLSMREFVEQMAAR